MKHTALETLKKYWGYDAFRPPQHDIINSVVAGHDTLALLPTGGGKSLCFQVPALMQEGFALVISPLIALMNDQVDNLKNRGIPAIALTSELSKLGYKYALESMLSDHYKVVYISPEKLKNKDFLAYLPNYNLSLIAIDEAHCISQWGYDFRPSYLKIKEIKTHLKKKVPFIALTATATQQVIEDIQQKLELENPQLFKKSFYRENLLYNVYYTENKWERLTITLSKIAGSAIVFTRNRLRTIEIADFLKNQGFTADFYHAGLSSEERSAKQKAWTENEIRVMVATNAFGMGIDKPDVRLVFHLQAPPSLEEYFQEAGRAGRDGKTAYAVYLYGPEEDSQEQIALNRKFIERNFVLDIIDRIYQDHQLAPGEGEDAVISLDLSKFSARNHWLASDVFEAIGIAERCNIWEVTHPFEAKSKVKIIQRDLGFLAKELPKKEFDFFSDLIRSYDSLHFDYKPIDEIKIAYNLSMTVKDCKAILETLHQREIIDYKKKGKNIELRLLQMRQPKKYITLDASFLELRKANILRKVKAVYRYLAHQEQCRSIQLLQYFDEKATTACGKCDVCRKKLRREKESTMNQKAQQAQQELLSLLQKNRDGMSRLELEGHFGIHLLKEVLENLTEQEKIKRQLNGKYILND